MSTPSGFETTDAQLRPILWLGAILGVVLLLSLVASSWVASGFGESLEATETEGPMQPFRETPSGPLLQASPVLEIEEHRAYENDMLNRYGVIDPENGIYRVPVSEATRLVLEEGLR